MCIYKCIFIDMHLPYRYYIVNNMTYYVYFELVPSRLDPLVNRYIPIDSMLI